VIVPQPNFSDTVIRSIETNPKISDARKQLLAKMLVGIATEVFSEQPHRDFWIALLGVESRYDGKAKSPVGATGIGQLMPKFANDFAKSCGFGAVTDADISDDYVNAYLSACEFRRLIKLANGSVPMALVFYNAGSHSNSVRQVKAGNAPVAETSAYVTKIMIRKDQMERE